MITNPTIGTPVRHLATGDRGIVTGRCSRDRNMIKVFWAAHLYTGWIEIMHVSERQKHVRP